MSLTTLSDSELVTSFQDSVVEEREKLVFQLDLISELDRRKLFFEYPSLWAYLVEEHGLETWSAERKIKAARLLRRFPQLKGLLESGQLNLTLLEAAQGCAHREKLSDPELFGLMESIAGMSTRAAMREIASRYPRSTELPRDRIRPFNAELSEVSFLANEDLLEKLDEARGLLAQSHKELKMADLIGILAQEFIERHSPEKKAERAIKREEKKIKAEGKKAQENEKSKSPSAQRVESHIDRRTPPQLMIRDLVKRDGYQCGYLDPVTQKRCFSKHALQVHHIRAWSEGGRTELSNLIFVCRAHHARLSFLEFGESSRYFKSK